MEAAVHSQAPVNRRLEVTVLYTGIENTLAALGKAQQLASGLDAHVLLLVALVVPYQVPLTAPPVSPDFLVGKLCGGVPRWSLNTGICICLCRDFRQALGKILKPNSLVVIGGRKRWWSTREQHLAREVGAAGHDVVFVDVR